MTDFVSTMQMHSQQAPRYLVDRERQLVADDIGGVDLASVTFSNEGWSSRAYLYNDGEVVYKFPRSEQVSADYHREIATLMLLDRVDCPVATQRFKSHGPNSSFSYFGLVGTQLSVKLPELGRDQKRAIGSALGRFVGYIQRFELADVPHISALQEVAEYTEKYAIAKPVIASVFSAKDQSTIATFFMEQVPSDAIRLGEDLRLCHGDLGSYNVILDERDAPGVIDFGNVGYYDTSKDFIDLGDRDVLEGALAAYGSDDALRQKISVRAIALQAIDIVYYMAKKDSDGIRHTTDRLRALLIDKSILYGGSGE